jgi:hypothetical protein
VRGDVATAPVEQRVRQLVTILRAPDLYVVKSSQVQYREYKDWTGDPMHSTECEDSTASLPRETRERLLRLRTDKARGSVDQLHPLIVLLLLLLLLFLLLLLLLLPLPLFLLLLPLLLLPLLLLLMPTPMPMRRTGSEWDILARQL